MSDNLLEVDNLTIQYQTQTGNLTAVSDVSFGLKQGEMYGLVGESGCGKSTIVKSIIGGLDDNGQITNGEIRFQDQTIQSEGGGQDLSNDVTWSEISWIPQASMNSLDPLETVGDQAVEIGKTHTDLSEPALLEKLEEMFVTMGLPTDRISDYPHQFSGGMQQRALIALALFLDPSIVIADEPTTALDVIMQDQVMKYLDRIKEDMETSIILITHDISVVLESCERMAVMHSGQFAETGTTADIFDSPRHPYAILLQEAFPDFRYPDRELEVIEGAPPQTFGDVDYCTFADRCPWAEDECRQSAPTLEIVEEDKPQHKAACFRKEEAYLDYQRGSQAESETQPIGED